MQLSPQALVVKRDNKKQQTVKYLASVPLSSKERNYDLDIHEDLCGCGDLQDGNDFTVSRRRQPVASSVRR